jgi:hypothetical protein
VHPEPIVKWRKKLIKTGFDYNDESLNNQLFSSNGKFTIKGDDFSFYNNLSKHLNESADN